MCMCLRLDNEWLEHKRNGRGFFCNNHIIIIPLIPFNSAQKPSVSVISNFSHKFVHSTNLEKCEYFHLHKYQIRLQFGFRTKLEWFVRWVHLFSTSICFSGKAAPISTELKSNFGCKQRKSSCSSEFNFKS